jgi:enhancing lycopene biosynthesis protein 2
MKQIIAYIAGKPLEFTTRDKEFDTSEIEEELKAKQIPYVIRDWYFKERRKIVKTPQGEYVRID